jgi:hypothetical protein
MALAGRAGAAESQPARDVPKFEAFKILLERNIFDPQRRPAERGAPVRQATVTTPTTERIALVGVLIDSGQATAFFDGTTSGGKVAIRVGGEIAGARLTQVSTDRVRLEKKGRTMDLPMAGQLSRGEKGDWEIAKEVIPLSGGGSGPGGSPLAADGKTTVSAAAGSAPSPSGNSQDETIRKLMERRRKEMGE